jgi:quinohemoprotein ethanol dehydrogenase
MRRMLTVIAGAALALAVGIGLDRAAAADSEITPSPAFDAAELGALPRSNWITNGGNVFNQRYSPLSGINRDNVSQLAADWRVSMGSGTTPRNSGQAQILVYEGVLYVSNGVNDVFAIDVDSGEILWTWRGNPHPRAGAPVGWSSRGVTMGDGRIYAATIDARLVALDQRTGEALWEIQAEPWEEGFSITSAPLYYDGMVITGFSGGEYGVRGRVKAYDAANGDLRWTFYTIPGPGELGHDTWPQDTDAWRQGGAPVWQTPAVDPELGMVYFSTGNPGPDLRGDVRPGDNLFSVSIVALDVHSGEYRWHFQQVRHDIWDYDSPNPVILFDAEYDGVMRKGLVQVAKTGWAYILDRETGEPLVGIDDRPVMQEPRQHTAATQPFPIGDAIVPQYIDIPPEGSTLRPDGSHVINEGRIFTPFWTEQRIALKPGVMGGANWPPSAYDPETNLLYVCATDRISTFIAAEELEEHEPGNVYMGGNFGQAQAEDRGIFAALDVRTNRLVWRQQWREICYSGSVVTAGGLLFVGRSDGRLTALDKRDGTLLWEFMTDAGVNTTVTTFEHQGRQRVVVHAGGSVFAGSERGDGIWMFSLEGTMGPVTTGGPPLGRPPMGPPAAVTPDDPSNGDAAASEAPGERASDLEQGRVLYTQACLACHGADGTGGHGGGPPIVGGLAHEAIMSISATGRNEMPGFAGVYSQQQLRDITAYVVGVLAGEGN